jgi:hypothetical protein
LASMADEINCNDDKSHGELHVRRKVYDFFSDNEVFQFSL